MYAIKLGLFLMGILKGNAVVLPIILVIFIRKYDVENKHYIKGYLVISPLIKIRHDIERCFCITNLAFDKNIVSYISNNYVFVNLK